MLNNLTKELSEGFQRVKAVTFAVVGFSLGIGTLSLLVYYFYQKVFTPFSTFMGWGL